MLDVDSKIRKMTDYCIHLCGTNDPRTISQFFNIHITIAPLGDALGYYRYIKRIKWIFINENIIGNTELANVVIAHELGHALLHAKENCTFMNYHTLMLTSKIEQQANVFAAYLLITDDLLREYINCTKDQFCNCTGYPKELIELRLR